MKIVALGLMTFVLLFAGVSMVVMGSIGSWKSVAIAVDGVKTTGRVVWTTGFGDDWGQATKVAFVAVEGERLTVHLFCFPFACFGAFADEVGTTVPVAYPRSNPSRALADTFSGRWLSPMSILFAGAVVASLGIAVAMEVMKLVRQSSTRA